LHFAFWAAALLAYGFFFAFLHCVALLRSMFPGIQGVRLLHCLEFFPYVEVMHTVRNLELGSVKIKTGSASSFLHGIWRITDTSSSPRTHICIIYTGGSRYFAAGARGRGPVAAHAFLEREWPRGLLYISYQLAEYHG